jgi:hypothetical protein
LPAAHCVEAALARARAAPSRHRAELAGEGADRLAQLGGRPSASPFQNGSRPGTPGAGVTRTRSWVMSSIRQLVAPRAKTSPTRDS